MADLEEALGNVLIEAIDNLDDSKVFEILLEKYDISTIINAINNEDEISEWLDKESLLHGLRDKNTIFEYDDLDDILDNLNNCIVFKYKLIDKQRMLEYLKEHMNEITVEDLELIIKQK